MPLREGHAPGIEPDVQGVADLFVVGGLVPEQLGDVLPQATDRMLRRLGGAAAAVGRMAAGLKAALRDGDKTRILPSPLLRALSSTRRATPPRSRWRRPSRSTVAASQRASRTMSSARIPT